MNDFTRLWEAVGERVSDATRRVGESGWYVLGKEVEAFERALGGVVQAPHVVGCASGLDAIELGLRALDLRPGGRVLTTPLSAFATSLAIVRAGGVPVFCDVDEHGLMDLEETAAALREHSGITHMVPVHLFGFPLDLSRLADIAAANGIRVVEDAAQAIGASFRDLPVGSAGGIAATSFYPTKNLGALGDGGAVWTADASLAQACHCLRDYGQTAKYRHDRLGLNSRLDELHAAILNSAMLPELAGWHSRRASIAGQYLDRITHPEVALIPPPRTSVPSWHLFPVRVASQRRQEFMLHLKREGIASAIHYPTLIPEQAALVGVPFVLHGALANARAWAQEEVSLPIHPFLTDTEVERVVAAVNGWQPA